MYQRRSIHTDVYSKTCLVCRNYVDNMQERAIWWFKIENEKFVKMTFKKSLNDTAFQCSTFSIVTYGVLDVELTVEIATASEHFRGHF